MLLIEGTFDLMMKWFEVDQNKVDFNPLSIKSASICFVK